MTGYGLGVDLGTTHTAAAVRVDGRVEAVQLGSRRPEIPSLVFVLPDGGVLVGEPAERRGATEPERLAREFKRRIGDPVPLLVGGAPYPAHALTARLLRQVFDIVAGQYDGPPTAITVTHPANWGPFKRELLEQAVHLADVGEVTYRTEPEAAAINFAAGERVRPGETVAVYDLGGGTFDAAVLRKTETGFALLGRPEGIEQLGGIDFDEAVFGHVVATLGSAVEDLDPEDDEATAALARLRRECTEAKEALTFDTEVMIQVALPGLHTRVRLNRSEFEAMIGPALSETVAATGRALRSAGVAAGDLRSIVLAGGSSRIPLVSQLLGAEFGRPVTLDPHPEHSIALGAAATTGPVTPPRPETAAPAAPSPPPPPPSSPSPSPEPAAARLPERIVATAAVRPVVAARADAGERLPRPPSALAARMRRMATRLGGKGRWVVAGAAALVLVATPAAVLAWPDSADPGGGGAPPANPTPTAGPAPTLLWAYPTGKPITGRAAVAGNAVYVGGQDGAVHAIDRTTGQRLWRYPTGSPVTSSPQVRGGVVYAAGQDGTLHAIGAGDGRRRWSKADAGQNPTLAGETLYVSGDETVRAFSLSGGRRWTYGADDPIATAPTASGDTVYATTEDGKVHAIDAARGDQRWVGRAGRDALSAPAVAGGLVHVGSAGRRLYALDAATGRERWSYTTTAGVAAAPLVTGDTVYFGASDGVVCALYVDDRSVRWRFTVDGGRPVPVLADGVLYVTSQADRIHSLDAATGDERWVSPLDGLDGAAARVDAGVMYVGAADGRLYALRLPPGLAPDITTPSATPSPTPSPSPTRVTPRKTKKPQPPRRSTDTPSPIEDTPPPTEPSVPPSPSPELDAASPPPDGGG
ncbi:outer membrane protein assembly factor BamB family protein [Phytohabitans sp. LJ34]|uniref:outer membrane protein assembly factor BamB family protein n=1 Tax=Phytohabitans sp. LJ34 TaxID=3452217 RepID=UPI003F893336